MWIEALVALANPRDCAGVPQRETISPMPNVGYNDFNNETTQLYTYRISNSSGGVIRVPDSLDSPLHLERAMWMKYWANTSSSQEHNTLVWRSTTRFTSCTVDCYEEQFHVDSVTSSERSHSRNWMHVDMRGIWKRLAVVWKGALEWGRLQVSVTCLLVADRQQIFTHTDATICRVDSNYTREVFFSIVLTSRGQRSNCCRP